jgi:hypothetical protein
MLLLGQILKDDFKPDFCNYVSTNVGIRTLNVIEWSVCSPRRVVLIAPRYVHSGVLLCCLISGPASLL